MIATVQFDALSLFGLIAVSLMLVFYAMESRAPRYVLGFAVACVMGSTYGSLQGAWPFGIVEAVWSLVALRRWSRLRRSADVPSPVPKSAGNVPKYSSSWATERI